MRAPATYDSSIAAWFAHELGDFAPGRFSIGGQLAQTMRYGENPHQEAAFYRFPGPRVGVSTATQLQGKELSYNNINDTDAAFELIAEFDPKAGPACAIIKHANPCGLATGRPCSRPTGARWPATRPAPSAASSP
jgi:phosphoribosylaminoimidazolecarboxamide formyltransferase/IMP cyclohydrolase